LPASHKEIVNSIMSPSNTPSFSRTCFLSGRRYVPDCLSGKMDVFHVVSPSVTSTGSEPNPRLCAPYISLISLDCFLSTLTKCHAAFSLGYSHTFDFILYFSFFISSLLQTFQHSAEC